MSTHTKSIIVIYHSADFDGEFCREIARLYYGERADYIGWNYGEPVPVIPEGIECLVMMDISIDELMAHPKLVWIDHHQTAIEKFPSTIPGYRIDGVAACRLAWQWFAALGFIETEEADRLAKLAMCNLPCGPGWGIPFKSQFVARIVTEPLAVRLAGEFDVWDERDPRAKIFQHALKSQPIDWRMLLDEDSSTGDYGTDQYFDQLMRAGEFLAYAAEKENARAIREIGFDLRWHGLTFLAANRQGNSLTFAAGIKPEHDGLLGFRWCGDKWRVSLYGVPGKPDIDFSAIAKLHGGGGHKQACGFECAVLPFGVHPLPIEAGGNHAKTAHQLARELLAGPDLAVCHFDPSFADASDEEADMTHSAPVIEIVDPKEGMSAEEIETTRERGFCLCPFITISGGQSPDDDRRDLNWAAAQVINERQRQIADEGYDVTHDDAHQRGELSAAGASYAMAASGQVKFRRSDMSDITPPSQWPWEARYWKLSEDPRRTLVKAGALILAEIERLDRLGLVKKGDV